MERLSRRRINLARSKNIHRCRIEVYSHQNKLMFFEIMSTRIKSVCVPTESNTNVKTRCTATKSGFCSAKSSPSAPNRSLHRYQLRSTASCRLVKENPPTTNRSMLPLNKTEPNRAAPSINRATSPKSSPNSCRIDLRLELGGNASSSKGVESFLGSLPCLVERGEVRRRGQPGRGSALLPAQAVGSSRATTAATPVTKMGVDQ